MKSPKSIKPFGYVYVIKSNGLYKIGRALNLDSRPAQLRTAAPFLKEVHTIRSRESRDLERWLHGHFNHKRIAGEWLALDDDDLEFISTVDGHGSQLTHTKLRLFCEKVKTKIDTEDAHVNRTTDTHAWAGRGD